MFDNLFEEKQIMISYAPMWKLLEEKGISTYALEKRFSIERHMINDLKHNKSITMASLEKICRVLECTPNDIVEFIEEEEK